MSTPLRADNYAKEIMGKTVRDHVIPILAWIAIAATFLAMIPFTPVIGPALEPWTIVMNEAVARHLAIGRDVVFTFGPFVSVYTQLYHPATYPITLIGSAILAAGICSGFALLSLERRPALLLALPFLVGVAWSRDAVFMAIPFLLMLVSFCITLPKSSENASEITGRKLILLVILSCAVGILPLVKVSFLAIALVEGAASVAMLTLAHRFRLAFTVTAIAAASLLLGWSWAGQPLSGIVHYVLAQRPIISGYSEAMSVEGPFSEVVFWAIPAAIVIAAFYAFITRGRGLVGLVALAGSALYLLFTFKAGFVRQDLHQHTSSATLLFIALALGTMLSTRRAFVVAAVAVAGWGLIEHSLMDFNPHFMSQRIQATYGSAYVGLKRRLTGQDSFPATFAQANDTQRNENPLTNVVGTADVYPMRIDFLFPNNIPWSGRPVIQSYSTYRPTLDQLNADHLTGDSAPDNVFFAATPIDGRLPSLEDALSWGVFLTNYSIVGQQLNFIHMRRTLPPRATSTTRLVDTDAKTNEPIAVPAHDGIVIARIHMRPTLLGQAVLMAYKLPQVYIELALTTGKTLRYRYIPEMGETGFVLSPLVASNDDFVAMAAGHNTASVKEIRLVSPSNLLWKKDIHMTLEILHVQPQADAQKFFSSAK